MTDVFSKVERSAVMAKVRGKDTTPELTVRRIVFALGYHYRLHCSDLPGKPDLVFPRHKKVIFVHGCFWHSHHCPAGTPPTSNTEYWLPKLTKNVERDKKNLRSLKRLGWKSLVIWECQLAKSPKSVERRIKKFLADTVSGIRTVG